ncbi:ADP-ribosylglycohydrolase family protein [Nocardioides sp.]|uniref:ADP-ribosylglycohydrolase family protein n=1 Tax=Nocardioides sp. TaxID=35761 RepID=UPI0035197520
MRQTTSLDLTPAQLDRAVGAVLASAVGDALGAGYEFGSAPYPGRPAMIGGGLGGFAPGEWTDDTAQAVAIARVAATGADLRSSEALDAIAAGFADWYAPGPPDVGIQTSQVLRLAGRTPTAVQMAHAAREVHERSGRSAGNVSLMRTAAVALPHLDDPAAVVAAARAISALTHHDPLAGDGAALWSLMIRHAILHGEFPTADDVVGHLGDTAAHWRGLLAEAETRPPSDFGSNAWVVGALQAAWSAIVHTPVPDGPLACVHLQDALATAIGIGHDTDTVAAIAGALLGARWGASAVPQEWQGVLHGWGVEGGPGAGAAGLVAAATLAVRGGEPDAAGWPTGDHVDYRRYDLAGTCVPLPGVTGVWIGDAAALDRLPSPTTPDITAVVSMCRVGRRQLPDGVVHHAVRLLDTTPAENPNAAFVIDDAARTVLRLRGAGHRVFLHCVAGQSRTPTVAARVAMLAGVPRETAVRDVVEALPDAYPQRWLLDVLTVLDAATDRPGPG